MGRRRQSRFNFSNMVPEVESSTRKGIFVVVLFVVAILSLLSIFDLAGGFGRVTYRILKLVFGWGFWIFPLILLMGAYLNLSVAKFVFRASNWIGMVLLILGYSGFFHLTQDPETFKQTLNQGIGGGYIGFLISYPFLKIMGRWAGMVVMFAFFVIGILMMFNTTLESIIAKISLKNLREWWQARREGKEVEYEEEEEEEEEDRKIDIGFEEKEIEGGDKEEEMAGEGEEEVKIKRKKRYPRIDMPLDLLSGEAGKPTSGDIKFCQETIRNTLAHFGIEVEMGEYSVGPTVTQYTFRPAEGVKLSRIVGLGNDLSLALAAHPIRIEAPIPGKSLVGIEVPNKKIAIVPLRQVLESKEFKERSSNLNIALGQDVAGKAWVTDLTKLPHLLVAGATNSGKTVCLNAIIISLLYQNQPNDLKLILVDPKRVEMTGYNGIPHLMAPVIVDIKKTVNALKWTISEMDRRFHILSNAGKRNIQSYNATHPREKLPYLVFIIDELADLMSMAGAEVEAAVIRLAQMSRAVGIHLILATQRPSVDIITGLIKANIPGRIAFSVASLTDSRTILDASGAEKLLGRGDMLYSSAEVSKPRRLQGAFCSDKDIENVVDYLRKQGEPDYEEAVTEKVVKSGLVGGVPGMVMDDEDSDELLDEARETAIKAGKVSASYLQRKLRIGYARAARILDLLENEGLIGPAEGSKPREVLNKEAIMPGGGFSRTEEVDYYDEAQEDDEEEIEDTKAEEETGEEESEDKIEGEKVEEVQEGKAEEIFQDEPEDEEEDKDRDMTDDYDRETRR